MSEHKHEGDAWDAAGAVPVSGEDLERGRSPEQGSSSSADIDLAADVTATDAEAGWNEAAEAKRAANPRTVALWSGRTALGLIAVGAACALGVAAVWAFGTATFAAEKEPVAEQIAPSAGEQQIVCAPGQLRVASDDGTNSIELVSETNTLIPEIEGSSASQLSISNVEGAELTAVSAPADADVLSGMAWTEADESEIAGFADSACTAPAATQWLVGGSTTTGRSSIIVLANPGEQPTTARVAVYGSDGSVDIAATTAIALEAGSATAIDLASLSVDNASPVVEVSSDNASVAAFMQHSIIRGLEPGGIDTIGAQASAGTNQTFVGVPLGGRTSANVDGDGSDVQPALRLLATDDTVARISFATPGQSPTITEIPLEAGRVVDMQLSDLPKGEYTIDVQSDAPVAAGVRVLPTSGPVSADFAWLTPSRTIDGAVTIDPRPLRNDRELVVFNPGDEPALLVVDGTEHTIEPGGLFSMEFAKEPVVLEAHGMRAAVIVRGEGIAGGYAVQPAPSAAAAVTVEY